MHASSVTNASPRVPIASVYLGLYDGPHATPKSADEGPIFLGIKNITEDGRLDLSEVRHIAEEDYPGWTRRVTPQPGDIVFTYEATLNRYAIIPQGFRGCLGRRLALIRPNVTKVDPKFLYYSFFGKEWRDTIASHTLSGSTVDRIPLTEFPTFEIRLPDLPIQRRIARILSAYDDLIENNTRRIAILEEMAQVLYREWFVHFRFPGHEGVPLVESELGPVPEGWELAKIRDVAKLSRDSLNPSKFPGELFSHYSIPAFDERHLPVSESGDAIHSNKFLIHGPSILLSKINPRIPRVWLVMPEEGARSLASTEFLVIAPRPPVSLEYLYSLLNFPEFEKEFMGLALGTSTSHQRVSPDDFMFMALVVPPAESILQFTDLVRPLLTLVQVLLRKNANLRRSRDLLLPKLISGELVTVELIGGV